MLRGLDKRILKTDLPVYVAEDPLTVVRGTGVVLKKH